VLWIAGETAIIACNLAEVIGAAIALQLLFGLPLLEGVAITVVEVFLVLWLQSRGFRYLEALVMALLLAISACFVVELSLAQPNVAALAASLLPTAQIVRDPKHVLPRHRNQAILVLAATFHAANHTEVHGIQEAYRLGSLMGAFINPPSVRATGAVLATAIATANGWLVWQTVS
jgi:NRAMP (natural resistance-associated macrophage protein)-like metal ion transporter